MTNCQLKKTPIESKFEQLKKSVNKGHIAKDLLVSAQRNVTV